jgi:hypothetical protein
VSGDTTQYVLDLAATLPVVISDTEAVYLYGLDIIAQQTERLYWEHGGRTVTCHPVMASGLECRHADAAVSAKSGSALGTLDPGSVFRLRRTTAARQELTHWRPLLPPCRTTWAGTATLGSPTGWATSMGQTRPRASATTSQ